MLLQLEQNSQALSQTGETHASTTFADVERLCCCFFHFSRHKTILGTHTACGHLELLQRRVPFQICRRSRRIMVTAIAVHTLGGKTCGRRVLHEAWQKRNCTHSSAVSARDRGNRGSSCLLNPGVDRTKFVDGCAKIVPVRSCQTGQRICTTVSRPPASSRTPNVTRKGDFATLSWSPALHARALPQRPRQRYTRLVLPVPKTRDWALALVHRATSREARRSSGDTWATRLESLAKSGKPVFSQPCELLNGHAPAMLGV